MAINFGNIKEGIAKGAAIAKDKAADVAGSASEIVAAGAEIVSDKASDAIREGRERWCSPLFRDEYESPDFDMPKIVCIADEDERKGIDVCEGAIGWLNTRRVPEIVFLYEEFAPESGIRFLPRRMCGEVYLRHPFENDLYLQTKDFLATCQRDQLTELKEIACMLGAVHYSVEVSEENSIVRNLKRSIKGNVDVLIPNSPQRARGGVERDSSSKNSCRESFRVVMEERFEAGVEPQRPNLRWFADDYEIQSLIEKRCNPEMGGELKHYSIDITSSATSALSANEASNIDISISSAKIKVGSKLAESLERESRKKFIYRIDF